MKSISFLFTLLLAGLFFVACKDSKNGAESTEQAVVVITADSLQYLKDGFNRSAATMQDVLTQKIAETEANIASTANETVKQELNTFLEKLKKVEENLHAASAKIAAATTETWMAVQEEALPALYETKSILTTGGVSTSPTRLDSGEKIMHWVRL